MATERLFCSECGQPYVITETETYRNLTCACHIISIKKDAKVTITASLVE